MYDLHKEHDVVFVKNHYGDPQKRREYLKNGNFDLSDAEIAEHVASMITYETILKCASPTEPYQIPYLIYRNGNYKIDKYKVWKVRGSTQAILEKLYSFIEDPSKTLLDMNNEFKVIPKKTFWESRGFPIIPFEYNQAFLNGLSVIESPAFDSIDELKIKVQQNPFLFPSYFFDFVDTLDGQNLQTTNAASLTMDTEDTPDSKITDIYTLIQQGGPHIVRRIRDYNLYLDSLKKYEDDNTTKKLDIKKILHDAELSNISFNFKLAYYVSVYQYIYFPLYDDAINKISAGNCIMHANEIRGFNTVKHEITNDIRLEIKTNFAYGNSSYFYTILYYKEIPITLFSFLLRFAYVEMEYMVKYTKSHRVKREGWDKALEYVKSVYETIESGGEKAFVEKYIIDELKNFLIYLKELKKDPISFVNKQYFRKKIEQDGKTTSILNNAEIKSYIAKCYAEKSIIDMRNEYNLPPIYQRATDLDKQKYKQILNCKDSLYATIAADKATSAIDFIQKLHTYDTAFHNPIFEEAVENIYEINREFKGLYNRGVDDLTKKIRYIDDFLEYLNNRLNIIKIKYIETTKELQQLTPLLPKIKKEIVKIFNKDERLKAVLTLKSESNWKTSVMLNEASPEVRILEENINQMVEKNQKLNEEKKLLESEKIEIENEISFLKEYKKMYQGMFDSLQQYIEKVDF